MRNYQMVIVSNSSLSDADRKKLLETVKSYLKGVKFTKEENWGEKNLSYTIDKQDKGFYSNFLFETDEQISTDLDKKLSVNEGVLRYLVLRK